MRSNTALVGLSFGAMNTLVIPERTRVPRRWRWHHATLLHLHSILTRAHAEHSQALRAPHDERSPDCVDAANDEEDRAELVAKMLAEETELAEVEAALTRLKNGNYGRCEKTGRPISPARLRAIPWARCA